MTGFQIEIVCPKLTWNLHIWVSRGKESNSIGQMKVMWVAWLGEASSVLKMVIVMLVMKLVTKMVMTRRRRKEIFKKITIFLFVAISISLLTKDREILRKMLYCE